MDSRSLVCSFCSQQPAVQFAMDSWTPRCEGCAVSESSIWLPIRLFDQRTKPRFKEIVQAHYRLKTQIQSELMENLTQIDSCIQELTSKIDAMQWILSKFLNSTIGKLTKIKSDLEDEIQHVMEDIDARLGAQDDDLDLELARLMRNFVQGAGQLSCFRYEIVESNRPTAPEEIIKYDRRHWADPEQKNTLVAPQSQKLLIFRCFSERSQTVQLHSPIQVSGSSSCLLLENGDVFCSGGYRAPSSFSTAYILGLDGSVQQQEDMMKPRSFHGLVLYEDAVYVFGGETYIGLGPFASCEMFSLTTRKWSKLPDMAYTRFKINPCISAGKVVICGGDSLKTMELFDLESMSFSTAISLQLPETSPCMSVLYGEDVVWISKTKLCYVSLKEEKMTEVKEHEEFESWSMCIPVSMREELYFIGVHGVRKVDLKDGKVLKQFSLDS